MGRVRAVCISEKRGTEKINIKEALFIKDFGIKDDAHADNWHRQISLLSYEKIEEFKKRGAKVEDGAFGENLVVEGFDFKNIPVGTIFKCNKVEIQITQIGKECHKHCRIYKQVGDCIMPREGVFARVIAGGTIKVGDEMEMISCDESSNING